MGSRYGIVPVISPIGKEKCCYKPMCFKFPDWENSLAATLGRLIRQVRKQQGHTLETLAGLCGLSIRFLSELENGRETCSLVRVLWYSTPWASS
jgi:DNA-binding XRE family transcriptional regulator